MGRPSNQKLSAQRPGQRERARVKRKFVGMRIPVSGDGTSLERLGRKKTEIYWRKLFDSMFDPSVGEPDKPEREAEA